MYRLKSTAATALMGVTLFGATAALACVPMPRNTAAELANARSAFIARVVSVETGDLETCATELRRANVGPDDLGGRSCEAFGLAELEPIHTIKGEDAIPENVIVEWNAHPFCYIGWEPTRGDVVVAMIPPDVSTLRNGSNAYVDPQDQHDPAMQARIAEAAGI